MNVVERSRSEKKQPERLIIGEKKYPHMMPEQLTIIVDRILAEVAGTKEAPEGINFSQFRTFLDKNPVLRSIVKESMKPEVWTLKGELAYPSNRGCFGPKLSSGPPNGGTGTPIPTDRKK